MPRDGDACPVSVVWSAPPTKALVVPAAPCYAKGCGCTPWVTVAAVPDRHLSRTADAPLSGEEAEAEIVLSFHHELMRTSFAALCLVMALTPSGAQSTRVIPRQVDSYFDLVRAQYSGERAKDLVAFMNGKSRWPGNTAFDASLDQVIPRLRAAGYVREDSA